MSVQETARTVPLMTLGVLHFIASSLRWAYGWIERNHANTD
jgi:hypothetical protein